VSLRQGRFRFECQYFFKKTMVYGHCLHKLIPGLPRKILLKKNISVFYLALPQLECLPTHFIPKRFYGHGLRGSSPIEFRRLVVEIFGCHINLFGP